MLIPRCPPADSAERVVQRFEVPGVSNYTALLLSPDGGTLYLGAREVLFAVNTSHFQHGVLARRVSPRARFQHHESMERAGDTEPSSGVGSWCILQLVRAAQRQLHQLCRHWVLRPSCWDLSGMGSSGAADIGTAEGCWGPVGDWALSDHPLSAAALGCR